MVALGAELSAGGAAAVPPQLLLTKVWGEAYSEDTEYLKVYVDRLRQTLEDDSGHPRYLLTERGIGYRFVRPDNAQAAPTGVAELARPVYPGVTVLNPARGGRVSLY